MLGLGFDAAHGKVYILNMGASKVQRIAANFNASTPVEDVADVPSIGAPGARTTGNPDGSTRHDHLRLERLSGTERDGVRQERQPVLLRFVPGRDLPDRERGDVRDALHGRPPSRTIRCSRRPGFPPFGANGLALSADGTTLFVANTGDDRVLKLDLATGDGLDVRREHQRRGRPRLRRRWPAVGLRQPGRRGRRAERGRTRHRAAGRVPGHQPGTGRRMGCCFRRAR